MLQKIDKPVVRFEILIILISILCLGCKNHSKRFPIPNSKYYDNYSLKLNFNFILGLIQKYYLFHKIKLAYFTGL